MKNQLKKTGLTLNKTIRCVFIVTFLMPVTPYAAELRVLSSGEVETGVLYLALYDGHNKRGWLSEPLRLYQTEINSQSPYPTISIQDLPNGRYAARAYIDINQNEKLDKNGMGVPKEPFALSSNIGSDKPARRFSKSLFLVKEGVNTLNLQFVDTRNKTQKQINKELIMP